MLLCRSFYLPIKHSIFVPLDKSINSRDSLCSNQTAH